MTATDTVTIGNMMKKLLRQAAVIVGGLFIFGLIVAVIQSGHWQPFQQSELFTSTVYAYRQWQSTGIYLKKGDVVTIEARGEWMYSPTVGWHSPEGGEPAPGYYPLSPGRGGALIGRVGETGEPFAVGRFYTYRAYSDGILFLRINDDLLGDNEGRLELDITVREPALEP